MLPYAGLHGNFLRNTCCSWALGEVLSLRSHKVRPSRLLRNDNQEQRFTVEHFIWKKKKKSSILNRSAVTKYISPQFTGFKVMTNLCCPLRQVLPPLTFLNTLMINHANVCLHF